MKYQCQNCQFCCITSSQDVSYCGSANDCVSTPITPGLALGLSFLCLAVFAIALLALYLRFMNRKISETNEEPQPNMQSEQIEPPHQPALNKQEKVEMREKKQDRLTSRSRSSKSSKFSKFASPSPTKTHTQRRLV